MKKRGYTTAEAASYVGVSESLLRQSRMVSKDIDGPKHTKLSCRKIIYLIEDLDDWLDRQATKTAQSISEGASK